MKLYIPIFVCFVCLTSIVFHFCGLFNLHWYGSIGAGILFFTMTFVTCNDLYEADKISEDVAFIISIVVFALLILALLPATIIKNESASTKEDEKKNIQKISKLEKQFNIKLSLKETKCEFVKFPFVLVGLLEDMGDKAKAVILKNNPKTKADGSISYCESIGDTVLIDKEHFIPGKQTFMITEGNILFKSDETNDE